MKSKLLFDKYPLVINPSLAVLIGLNEAIVLQQIHYWIVFNEDSSKNFHKGKYWTYNTYEEWRVQFPFWSVMTIKRTINRLEQRGYISSGNFNTFKWDRTKWYTINYEAINLLNDLVWQPYPGGEKIPYPLYQNDPLHCTNMDRTKVQSGMTNTRD